MIEIGNPDQAVEPAVFASPGGFAWWYVDVITPEGDGLVLIWSYGLPFLPGYAASARRGTPQRPLSRPSVNVALYRSGKEAIYLLQEYPPASAASADRQVIGECRFSGYARQGRFALHVELDCPVPGTGDRLIGTVRLDGAARAPMAAHTVPGDPPHLWTPLAAPATATVELAIGGTPVATFTGRAYHDRNTGLVPLHELGIHRWMWGRFPLGDSEFVYYLLWPHDGGPPRCIGLEMLADGGTREVSGLRAEIGEERGTRFGLRLPRGVRMLRGGEPWLEVEHTATPELGPFYARFQSRAVLQGQQQALGWGELCEPDRVDQPWLRPLVRMRVQRTGRANSLWLPLFNGSRQDRWRRLVRHALGGRR